jgi:hypothetical protein
LFLGKIFPEIRSEREREIERETYEVVEVGSVGARREEKRESEEEAESHCDGAPQHSEAELHAGASLCGACGSMVRHFRWL